MTSGSGLGNAVINSNKRVRRRFEVILSLLLTFIPAILVASKQEPVSVKTGVFCRILISHISFFNVVMFLGRGGEEV